MLPVLVVFFNRPDILSRCVENLIKIKPKKIYFSSDGPRKNFKNDSLLINNCINIINNVSWECEISFLKSDLNIGCDEWVPKSISWFFENEGSGIILEDDCLISKDFYEFSSIMIERYKNNEKIMNISAANFHKEKWGKFDYYFSAYPANWGWATTSVAWNKYCRNMEGLDNFLDDIDLFKSIIPDREIREYWVKFFKGLESKKYTYWDAKWTYSIWKHNGLSITPNYNLVKNIGFGQNATHTKFVDEDFSPSIQSISSILKHPAGFEINYQADRSLYYLKYKPTLKSYFNKLRTMLDGITRE